MSKKLSKEDLILEIDLNGKSLLKLQQEHAKLIEKESLLRYDLRLLDAKRFVTKEKNFGSKKKPELHQVKYMVFDESFQDDDDPGNPVIIERKMPIEVDGRKINERWQFIEPASK